MASFCGLDHPIDRSGLTRFMTNIAYLNGVFLPLEEARVPAMDRGFLFGDGVYEIIPVYSGQPFRLQQHLERLEKSLAAIRLSIPMTVAELSQLCQELIQRNNNNDQSLYLQCTRGPVTTREHNFPAAIHPTIFAYCAPLQTPTFAELNAGITAITVPDIRWQRCDIKAITLLANVLARQQAQEQNAQEAILIRQDYALEGSISNLFVVHSGIILTPPMQNHILGGITREVVLELAKEHGLPYGEINITEEQLRNADEIWLTSSSKEIRPVIKLDGKPVSNGKPGPVWTKMIQYYQQLKERSRIPK